MPSSEVSFLLFFKSFTWISFIPYDLWNRLAVTVPSGLIKYPYFIGICLRMFKVIGLLLGNRSYIIVSLIFYELGTLVHCICCYTTLLTRIYIYMDNGSSYEPVVKVGLGFLARLIICVLASKIVIHFRRYYSIGKTSYEYCYLMFHSSSFIDSILGLLSGFQTLLSICSFSNSSLYLFSIDL